MKSRTTKFTPFKLLYGEEAITPEEIKLRSWRTSEEAGATEENIKPSINTIKAGKIQAEINLGRYQEETRRWKNKKVKPRYDFADRNIYYFSGSPAKKCFKVIPCKQGHLNIKKSLHHKSLGDDT